MRHNQSGTLYELYIIALLLVIVGGALSDKHPAFLVLVVAGIGIFLLPTILNMLGWLVTIFHHAPAAKKRLKDLCTQGFKPAAVVRAQVSESGAYVAVDIEAGKVAFITPETSQLLDLSAIKEVQLTSGTIMQWGKPDRKRYGFNFVPKDNTKNFGLSYPKKSKAVKAFNSLRKVLDGRVTFVEHGDE